MKKCVAIWNVFSHVEILIFYLNEVSGCHNHLHHVKTFLLRHDHFLLFCSSLIFSMKIYSIYENKSYSNRIPM